jgi:hypothetical protein
LLNKTPRASPRAVELTVAAKLRWCFCVNVTYCILKSEIYVVDDYILHRVLQAPCMMLKHLNLISDSDLFLVQESVLFKLANIFIVGSRKKG